MDVAAGGRRLVGLASRAAEALLAFGGLAYTVVLAESGDSEFSGVVIALGVIATICAWMLLHTGYARFYSTWADDLRYPKTPDPGIIDHLTRNALRRF